MNRSLEDQGGTTHPTEKNFVENLKHIVFNEDQKEISCGICLETFKKALLTPQEVQSFEAQVIRTYMSRKIRQGWIITEKWTRLYPLFSNRRFGVRIVAYC